MYHLLVEQAFASFMSDTQIGNTHDNQVKAQSSGALTKKAKPAAVVNTAKAVPIRRLERMDSEQALSCFMIDSLSGTASSSNAINSAAGSLPMPCGPFAPNADDNNLEPDSFSWIAGSHLQVSNTIEEESGLDEFALRISCLTFPFGSFCQA